MSTDTNSPSRVKKPRAPKASPVNFFPFQWQHEDIFIDDEEKCLQTVIRIYGWNEKNESTYIRVEDFPIPIWVELPTNVEWTDGNFEKLRDRLSTLQKEEMLNPKNIVLQYKQPLYFASIEEDYRRKEKELKTKSEAQADEKKQEETKSEDDKKYKVKTFPYLQVTFRNMKAVEFFVGKLRYELIVPGLGKLKLKCHCYDRGISPIIKLLAFKQLPSANWILANCTPIPEEQRETSKQHEYLCSFKNLKTHPEPYSLPIVYPKVLSFDNEAFSSTPKSMPKSHLTDDKVFMIGCTISYMRDKQKVVDKYILHLKDCAPLEGVKLIKFNTELLLYIGFAKFVQEHDPDVIIGYNIFGWDLPFMVERCEKLLGCLMDFQRMGSIKNKICPVMRESWESEAYGRQDLTYLECDGRLFIDMMPYIMRNSKLSNYRLKTVCEEFLKNQNKTDLTADEMFFLYKRGNPEDMKEIAVYCAQDSYVTYLLYEQRMTWFDLTETATTNGVPIFYIYTKGQQIKIYAQILKYCAKNNIVVQSNAYTVGENEEYVGASVTQPIAGLYKTILPFDFASLYPSIIMAYNLDYATLVTDPNIPDELCHVIEWEDHLNCRCPKDPKRDSKRAPQKGKNGKVKRVCGQFKYRFLKHHVVGKGVIPTLLENLIKARKDTRKIIAAQEELIDNYEEYCKLKKENVDNVYQYKGDFPNSEKQFYSYIETYGTDFEKIASEVTRLEEVNNVLDKRQLSYKVSANSMYGAMGVKQGRLPFLPGAMCTTYIGRQSIKKASRFLEEECGGQVIYNDTDSAYTYFPCLRGKSADEIWKFAEDVVKRVAKLFPPPMKLEFEDKVYHKFLILTKKRYVALPIKQNGEIEKKLFKRGVVLQRRDNCPLLRNIYQETVWDILNNIDELTQLSPQMSRTEILSHPVVSMMLTKITNGINNALFEYAHPYQNFVITKALKKEANEYTQKTVPTHVYVAKKMQQRGIQVPANSRIEYVLLDSGNGYQKKELQNMKAEDITFYLDNKENLRLDYLYYLEKQFVKPLTELLKVVIFQPKIIKEHLQHRIQKSMMITQLKSLFKPRIQFLDDLVTDWEHMSLFQYLYKYNGVPYQYRDFFYRDDVVTELDFISDALQEEKRIFYPPLHQVFRAFHHPLDRPKVVILGQDPYFDGAACGLAFSVEREGPLNPSLVNILKEVDRCGFDVDFKNGSLEKWNSQGVMLLNTALTVCHGQQESHLYLWKKFTQMFLTYLQERFGQSSPSRMPLVGMLWGKKAIDYRAYFDQTVCCSHPSPLGANSTCGGFPAFVGSKCFQKVNAILTNYQTRIHWDTGNTTFDLPQPSDTKKQESEKRELPKAPVKKEATKKEPVKTETSKK